jgi:hypothetical protein
VIFYGVVRLLAIHVQPPVGHVLKRMNVVYVKATALLVQAVLMVNLIVAMKVVHMVSVSMTLGHVTVMMTALMAQMKLIVLQLVVMIHNLTVVMDLVSMAHGHVMDGVTVLMAQMKLIVLLHLVLIRDCGIVAMANVFQHHTYVMAQMNFVTQAGVLTVPMVQMKA